VNNWIGATLEADGDSDRLAARPPVQLARSGQVADSPSPAAAIILPGVSRRTPPPKPLRSWRVIIIRSKGEYLGSVEAPDRERAEAVAVKQFDLDQGRRF
jgi:hypothetical protein